MSFAYIQDYYQVPAAEGVRVEYTGERTPKLGTIVGTQNAHVMIKLDGELQTKPYHPTWELRYLEGAPA